MNRPPLRLFSCPQAVGAMLQACRSPDPLQQPTAAQVLRCLQQEMDGPAAWSSV